MHSSSGEMLPKSNSGVELFNLVQSCLNHKIPTRCYYSAGNSLRLLTAVAKQQHSTSARKPSLGHFCSHTRMAYAEANEVPLWPGTRLMTENKIFRNVQDELDCPSDFHRCSCLLFSKGRTSTDLRHFCGRNRQ